MVSTLYRNRKRKKQIETLENDDIDYLVRKDPMTCTRYYRHTLNALRLLICHAYTRKVACNAGGTIVHSTFSSTQQINVRYLVKAL
jgi:hypothetical protein